MDHVTARIPSDLEKRVLMAKKSGDEDVYGGGNHRSGWGGWPRKMKFKPAIGDTTSGSFTFPELTLSQIKNPEM